MKFTVGIFIILFSTFSIAADREECTCYAAGYAYSHQTKTYYFTPTVKSFIYKKSTSFCENISSPAENKWHDFFNSEVVGNNGYVTAIAEICNDSDKAFLTKHMATNMTLNITSRHRRKEFNIKELGGFSLGY